LYEVRAPSAGTSLQSIQQEPGRLPDLVLRLSAQRGPAEEGDSPRALAADQGQALSSGACIPSGCIGKAPTAVPPEPGEVQGGSACQARQDPRGTDGGDFLRRGRQAMQVPLRALRRPSRHGPQATGSDVAQPGPCRPLGPGRGAFLRQRATGPSPLQSTEGTPSRRAAAFVGRGFPQTTDEGRSASAGCRHSARSAWRSP